MRPFIALVLGLGGVIGTSTSLAENTAHIGSSGQDYRGNLMVNQAAGDWQQQANSRAIAIGHGSQTSIAIQQDIEALPASAAGNAKAEIAGAAFSRGSGILGINQGAGIGNQQINALRLQQGVAAHSLDDDELAQSASLSPLSGAAESLAGSRLVVTDDKAFSGSRGVVQLNQSAGVGNQSANSFGIRVVEAP
ncbi:adhesin [Pseudomonas sp. GOM6]|uniref:adhesin n=1 Tax=Pseudomonas sp. GOM6 TaxID=3036944 RepID=UPI00240A90BC|nr:adhesin [Pseudomonas sp. GOM6]MDG1582471.1 adhesin [Pseudomonas sp. GOM6]